MQILYLLESIRTPLLDVIMSALTLLGGETAFLVIALVMFWCVDRRKAYYMMSVGFIGTIANQFLKIACRIPRPWVKDPNFTIVEAAREDATGYSFPSGHSQNAVGTFGAIAATTKSKHLRVASIAAAVIVPISRLYLGVHTPQDVLAGAGMALVLLVVLRPIIFSGDGRHIPKLFLGMCALAAAYLAYTELFPFPAGTDPVNLESARSNAYTLLGTMLGMTIVYFVEEKRNSPMGGKWYAQVLKVAGGLVIALAVKGILKAPLEAAMGGHLFNRSIRYFLLVIAAGAVWPMTFPWFSKLGKEK